MLYCLCTKEFERNIATKGYLNGPRAVWRDVEPCQGFDKHYSGKNAMVFVASSVMVVVNVLLDGILLTLASFERHASESTRASALATKTFLAQFLNTAIIVLIINAYFSLENVPIAKDMLKGKYHDFDRDWYPTVGMAITMTLFFDAFGVHIVLALQVMVLAPLKRMYFRRSIRTQDRMNKLYAGPPFALAVRYPVVLNSVIITMMFAGGSPILLFIATLACDGTFWLEKISIRKVYSVKTAYDENLNKVALSVLWWTLKVHACFSAWMYGNDDLVYGGSNLVYRISTCHFKCWEESHIPLTEAASMVWGHGSKATLS